MPQLPAAAANWATAIANGERRVIARALTAVENNTSQCAEILAAVDTLPRRARIIGITGPPGVGKSTLVGACIGELRVREMTVGVVAVDPSSPVSGGALLGDRVRMQVSANDRGVFIRSLASRGHLGGLSLAAHRTVDVLNAAGMDVILIETVGIGQSEVEIAQLAQTRVVVLQPGAGDDIQALKAGVIEIGDLLVINKSDLSGADTLLTELQQMLQLRRPGSQDVPILKSNALSGAGISELVDSMLSVASTRPSTVELREVRALLARETGARVSHLLLSDSGTEIQRLCEQIQANDISLQQAVEMLAARVSTR